jgi:hypothetical protein
MSTATAALSAPRAREKERWLAALEELMRDIEQWSAEQDWQLARLKKKTIREPGIGTYSVSDLRIRTHSGVLNVEVVARDIVGADGRVDLVSFPAMDRFIIIHTGGRWMVHDDYGRARPRRWCKKTFVDVAEQLTKPL